VLGRDGGPALSAPKRSYHDSVTVRRHAARLALASRSGIALSAVLLLAAGCGSTPPPPIPSATVTTAHSPAAPSLTAVPGAPSPAATLPATSDTDFGKVWDAVPSSWPKMPGQSEGGVASDASASLVVRGQPVALAGVLAAALEKRGWNVDVGSPLEDGSVVLDATAQPPGCKAQARFSPDAPGSDTDTLLIYYGATCPFN
jgi:hypothetical protein